MQRHHLLIAAIAIAACTTITYRALTLDFASTSESPIEQSTHLSNRALHTSATSDSSSGALAPDTTPASQHEGRMSDASVWKHTTTTIFWIGEPADSSNGHIANDVSAWDDQWQEHYGGIDDPEKRCGYLPCLFTPNENPFYIALPYNDLSDAGGIRQSAASEVPWWSASSTKRSQVKNTWIAITYGPRTCYGQWQDVGPYLEFDAAYVFGTSTPKNTFGLDAGLDVSPALATCLHLDGAGVTQWRFIDAAAVPPGPWKEVITTRDVSWN